MSYISKQDAPDLIRNGDLEGWQDYRERHPGWKPDLAHEHLGYEKIAQFDLSGADIRGSDLSGAILIAGFNAIILTGTAFDGNSRFPEGFRANEH